MRIPFTCPTHRPSKSLLAYLLLAVLRGLVTHDVAMGADAPIELPAADGSTKKPFETLDKTIANRAHESKAVVLIFFLHDCPICNAYAPEIERIKALYEPQGFAFFIVQTDASLNAAAALQHAKEYSLSASVLLDRENRLARQFGATLTPEVAVIGAGKSLANDLSVLYLGRIDDLFADYGKRRPEPTTRDLRLALDAILAGNPVPKATGAPVGCYIPLGKRDDSRK